VDVEMSPTFIGSRFGVDTRIGSDDGSPPRSRAGVRFRIYLLDRGAAVSMATTVYFDLDGTLLDYEVPSRALYADGSGRPDR